MSDKIKVLVGDDDANMTEAMHDYLTRKGFEVRTVGSTPDLALDALSDFEPDIIISDFDYGFYRSDDLPDGVAVGKYLQSKGSTVPFVICSGLDRDEATEAGFDQWGKGDVLALPDKIRAKVTESCN